MNRIQTAACAALAIAALGGAGALMAQGLQRTVIGRADVSVPGREAVVARVEIAPQSRERWRSFLAACRQDGIGES